jgi:hypothetical protein
MIVTGAQKRGRARKLLPLTSLGCARVFEAQSAVAFESDRDEEPALPCCVPEASSAVPLGESTRHPRLFAGETDQFVFANTNWSYFSHIIIDNVE